MKKFQPLIPVTLFFALSLPGTAVLADDADELMRKAQRFELITPERAAEIATSHKPGYVDDIDLERRKFGKGYYYEVEIDDENGVEWEVHVDAKTGEVLRIKRDW